MRIGGLIDAERAFWGDPLADVAALALLDDIRRDEDFLTAYREAGGPAVLDASSSVRLSLYRSYLYLILLVEAVPRHYGPATYEWLGPKVAPALASELDLLATYLTPALRTPTPHHPHEPSPPGGHPRDPHRGARTG